MSRDPDSPPDGHRFPRRATDRVEDLVAWLLMAAALVVLVVAWSAGMAVHNGKAASASTMTRTQAVLLEDAIANFGEPGVHLPVSVEARWADRAGVERFGEIRVKGPAPAGTEVDAWVSADGAATSISLRRENAVAAGIIVAAGLLLAGGSVLATAWYGVRSLTAARNARRWEREWAKVGPEWSGRRRWSS